MSGTLRFEKILLEQVANADGRPQGSPKEASRWPGRWPWLPLGIDSVSLDRSRKIVAFSVRPPWQPPAANRPTTPTHWDWTAIGA